MVILGTHEAAVELLDDRSANYSSRVPSAMALLYVLSPFTLRRILACASYECGYVSSRAGWEWAFTLMPYGPIWRRRRKELHKFFHPNAIMQYIPLQQREAVKFVKKLLDRPDTFLQHVRQ